MRRIPLRLWLFVAASSLLQTFPFPIAGPMPVWRTMISWFALTPMLFALGQDDRFGRPLTWWQGGALGYLSGILWYLGNCYWIYQTMYLYGGLPKAVAIAVLLLFCLYLGLYHALFAAIFVVVRRSRPGFQGALLLSPFLWVAVELARARLTGFPWDLLGVTQVDHPLLLRLAPFTGVYGLSFLVAAINMLWLLRLKIQERRGLRSMLVAGAMLVLVLYSGTIRRFQLPAPRETTRNAALLQENLGVGKEADENVETRAELLNAFSELSLRSPSKRCNGIPELPSTVCASVESEGPTDLVAWPESPAGFRSDDPDFRRRLAELARATGSPLVVGSLGLDADVTAARGLREYDSANLISADGSYTGRYDKIHLVPWGEYVPFRRFFSFADRLTAGVGDMDRGTMRTLFSVDGHKVGVFICYESIFGDEVRQFVRDGAEVLVNISDDGWYGDTSAAWQHLNMVRMRAAENRRWILRSTNTGVTAAIDPYGRVSVAAPRHIRTALRAGFNFESETTFYSKFGDLFAYGCALISAGAVGYSLRGYGRTLEERVREGRRRFPTVMTNKKGKGEG